MNQLSTEQLLYLFYTFAYAKGGSVTQGTVKGYLPGELRKKADIICNELCQKSLLESPKPRRISITPLGEKTLVKNLQTTDYKFDSSKGYNVTNALLLCLKMASTDLQTLSESVEEMDFETFVEKFKKLYFEERKRQELRGVVAIHSQDICKEFMQQNPISESKLVKYFDKLKSTGKIFAVTEKDLELIQWVE